MDELLEMLFGRAGRPVRRDLKLHITRDNDGNETVEALSASAIMLSEEGSIDQLEATQQLFHSCGCSAAIEVGGVCSEPGCGHVSCARCFAKARCQVCEKSLCLPHTERLFVEGRGEVRVCKMCEDEILWKALLSRATFGLLPPPRS